MIYIIIQIERDREREKNIEREKGVSVSLVSLFLCRLFNAKAILLEEL